MNGVEGSRQSSAHFRAFSRLDRHRLKRDAQRPPAGTARRRGRVHTKIPRAKAFGSCGPRVRGGSLSTWVRGCGGGGASEGRRSEPPLNSSSKRTGQLKRKNWVLSLEESGKCPADVNTRGTAHVPQSDMPCKFPRFASTREQPNHGADSGVEKYSRDFKSLH